MGPIFNSVGRFADNRANTEYTLNQVINARHRMDTDLTDLVTTIDKESWALYQNGGDTAVLLTSVRNKAIVIFEGFKDSDIYPTDDQLSWISHKLNQVTDLLHERGAKHVEDLKYDRHRDSLRVEGGDGYTVKFLGENWSVYKRDPTPNPIPELQDRVSYLCSTNQTILDIQREMAKLMDETNEEIAKLQKKFMGSIYSNGERTIKVFRKTSSWINAPPRVKIQSFKEHLDSLNLKSTPAIDIIKPRSGSNSFLKVTFLGDGEKNEFTRRNKASTNRFETRPLTPIAAQGYEREAKLSVKGEVTRFLKELGYNIPDTEIGTYVMAHHRPDFHLQIRVFIGSGLPSITKGGKPHSFIIKLDGSEIEPQIETGLRDLPPIPTSRAGQFNRDTRSKESTGTGEPEKAPESRNPTGDTQPKPPATSGNRQVPAIAVKGAEGATKHVAGIPPHTNPVQESNSCFTDVIDPAADSNLDFGPQSLQRNKNRKRRGRKPIRGTRPPAGNNSNPEVNVENTEGNEIGNKTSAHDSSNNDSSDSNHNMHSIDKIDGAGLMPKATSSTVTESIGENDHESHKHTGDGEINSPKPPDNSNNLYSPGLRNLPMHCLPESFHIPGRITLSPRNNNLNGEPSMIDKLELKPASKESSSSVKPPLRSIAKIT